MGSYLRFFFFGVGSDGVTGVAVEEEGEGGRGGWEGFSPFFNRSGKE